MSTQQDMRPTSDGGPAMGPNADLVMRVMGAMRNGDVDAAASHVSDDFVWHIPGTSAISGDAAGLSGLAQKLQRLAGAGLQPQVLSMLEGESHVASLQRNVAETDGHRLDQEIVNLFTVTDGKISRLDTFFSDQPAAESFWDAALG